MLCTACGPQTLVDETHLLENNTWMRFEPEVFRLKCNDPDACYNVCFTISYDTTVVKDNSLPIVVDFYADSNELHNYFRTISFFDRKGGRLGTMTGTFCTVTDTLDRYRYYNHSDPYTYRIKQRTSRYELPGISSVGLKVEEANMSLKGKKLGK